jgi:hypothetical protein
VPEVAQIQRDREWKLGRREEVVILLMYLRFPDPQERICRLDIDTVVPVRQHERTDGGVNDSDDSEHRQRWPRVRIHGLVGRSCCL